MKHMVKSKLARLTLRLPFFNKEGGQKVVLKNQRGEIPDSEQQQHNLLQITSGNTIGILFHFEKKPIFRKSF